MLVRPARAYGLQLYTVRDAMRGDVERTLGRVAQLGYTEVEFAGYFGRTAAQITAALATAGLRAPSAHIDLESIRGRWPATLEDAGSAGHEFLVLPWIQPELRSAEGYARLADELNQAGTVARDAGIRLAYHNQEYDFASVGDGTGLHELMARTDRKCVSLQLDVFWALRGGRDPGALLERYADRIRMLHLKGMAADGSMADVGAGVVDYPGILRRAAGTVEHLFVEHDEPADAFASARASLEYLRTIEE